MLAILAVGLLGAAPPAAKAPPPPAHRGYPPGTVYEVVEHITLVGEVTVRAGYRVRHRHLDDHIVIRRRATVLATADHRVTRLKVTYLQVDTPGRGELVPPELRDRTFVITRGASGQAMPTVTEYGAEVDTDVAQRIVADNLDVFLPDPVLRLYRTVFHRPGKRVVLPASLVDRMLRRPGSDVHLVSASARLVTVEDGVAHIAIDDRFATTGPIHVTGHGTGEATYDVRTGRELSVTYAIPIRSHGSVHRRGRHVRTHGRAIEHLSTVYTYRSAPAPGHHG